MADKDNNNPPNFDAELRQRFARAGYWFRMWPTHPALGKTGHGNARQLASAGPVIHPQAAPGPLYPPSPGPSPGHHTAPSNVPQASASESQNTSYLLDPSQY